MNKSPIASAPISRFSVASFNTVRSSIAAPPSGNYYFPPITSELSRFFFYKFSSQISNVVFIRASRGMKRQRRPQPPSDCRPEISWRIIFFAPSLAKSPFEARGHLLSFRHGYYYLCHLDNPRLRVVNYMAVNLIPSRLETEARPPLQTVINMYVHICVCVRSRD